MQEIWKAHTSIVRWRCRSSESESENWWWLVTFRARDHLLQVLFIGLVLLTPRSTGSCAGAIAGKRRIRYSGSCQPCALFVTCARFPDSKMLVHMNLPGSHGTSTHWVLEYFFVLKLQPSSILNRLLSHLEVSSLTRFKPIIIDTGRATCVAFFQVLRRLS